MPRFIILLTLFFILPAASASHAWVYVDDYGDTGWKTYVYQVGPEGFQGTAGFVVSNVIDNAAYSELLLDNLTSSSGSVNCSFELGDYTNCTLLGDSFGEVTWSVKAYNGTIYSPTQGEFLSHQCCLETGISTAAFQNATQQAGTVGSILETAVSLASGDRFTFDWAFLAGDQSPYNDFALFYLKDATGKIVFTDGLAQINKVSIKPLVPAIIGILSLGLLSLRGEPTFQRQRSIEELWVLKRGRPG